MHYNILQCKHNHNTYEYYDWDLYLELFYVGFWLNYDDVCGTSGK